MKGISFLLFFALEVVKFALSDFLVLAAAEVLIPPMLKKSLIFVLFVD